MPDFFITQLVYNMGEELSGHKYEKGKRKKHYLRHE